MSYAYASGKIRALEPMILDSVDIERMVDAPDFETAFKVFNDTDYADNLLTVQPLEYREALREDFRQLYNLLKSITPDKELFQLMYIERDFLNLRYLLKVKHFGLDVGGKEYLNTDVVYPNGQLKEYVLNDKDEGLEKNFKKTIDAIQKELPKENVEPSAIDTIVTKYCFDYQLKLAQKTGSKLISDLVKIQIDNANLITWLRGKRLKIGADKIREKFFTGGNVAINDLLRIYDDEAKSLRSVIHRYYDKNLLEAFDQYCENNFLFGLEKAFEDFVTTHIQKAKRISYGPEVVIAYYWAKKIAVRNAILIMTGKFNKVPGEDIKKTLRKIY